KCDLLARFWIPNGRVFRALTNSQTSDVLSIPVRNVDFGIAAITAGSECDLAPVRRPCRRECISAGSLECVRPVIGSGEDFDIRRSAPKTGKGNFFGVRGP